MDEECPECGEILDVEDWHYMEMNGCCKCCYDDYHFGEENDNGNSKAKRH